MKVGDIVKIVKQPSNLLPKVVGSVGYIDEIVDDIDFVGFIGLNLDGSYSSAGSIPLDCLEFEHGVEWKKAKDIRDEKVKLYLEESIKSNELINNQVKSIAEKYNLSEDIIRSIYKDMDSVLGY